MEKISKPKEDPEFFSEEELNALIQRECDPREARIHMITLERQKARLLETKDEVYTAVSEKENRPQRSQRKWEKERRLYGRYVKELLPLIDIAIEKLRKEAFPEDNAE